MKSIDFTTAVSLIGDSFSSRVSVLENLIGHTHYPSIGGYKERLLIGALRDYLPKSCEIGTGFVIFLREPSETDLHPYFDQLNQAGYSVSKQCDIIIYDSGTFSPIFRDGEFVVVRPESVIAVLEVKGSLGRKSITECNEFFWDFSEKWKRSEKYHTNRERPDHLKYPFCSMIAWDMKRRSDSRFEVHPEAIRDAICLFWGSKLSSDPWKSRPFLESVYIYSTAIIGHCVSSFGSDLTSGYFISSGKFLRRNPDETLEYRGDKTISSLLASIHYHINPDNFNRFFSYADEVKHVKEKELFRKPYEKVWSFPRKGKRKNP